MHCLHNKSFCFYILYKVINLLNNLIQLYIFTQGYAVLCPFIYVLCFYFLCFFVCLYTMSPLCAYSSICMSSICMFFHVYVLPMLYAHVFYKYILPWVCPSISMSHHEYFSLWLCPSVSISPLCKVSFLCMYLISLLVYVTLYICQSLCIFLHRYFSSHICPFLYISSFVCPMFSLCVSPFISPTCACFSMWTFPYVYVPLFIYCFLYVSSFVCSSIRMSLLCVCLFRVHVLPCVCCSIYKSLCMYNA